MSVSSCSRTRTVVSLSGRGEEFRLSVQNLRPSRCKGQKNLASCWFYEMVLGKLTQWKLHGRVMKYGRERRELFTKFIVGKTDWRAKCRQYLRSRMYGCKRDRTGCEMSSVACTCEHINGQSVSTKFGHFLERLSQIHGACKQLDTGCSSRASSYYRQVTRYFGCWSGTMHLLTSCHVNWLSVHSLWAWIYDAEVRYESIRGKHLIKSCTSFSFHSRSSIRIINLVLVRNECCYVTVNF